MNIIWSVLRIVIEDGLDSQILKYFVKLSAPALTYNCTVAYSEEGEGIFPQAKR